MVHPNSIQPETTLQINAESKINKAPDIAYITAGVTEERATASEAMTAQSASMNGVFAAPSRMVSIMRISEMQD